MKLSEVPMEKLMEALPKLSTQNTDGGAVSFNLKTQVEEGRVSRPDWFLHFDEKGDITCGGGSKENAISFVLKKGGLNTLLGMMLDGLSGQPRGAMTAMMTGAVGIEPFSPENLKKTQSFFDRVKIGEETLKKALADVGVQVEEIDI